MQASLEPVRLLADTMNYLDHTYCRESILEWVRTAPEGAAYSIVRELLVQLVEESGKGATLLQAA
jgi:hypothetical protein